MNASVGTPNGIHEITGDFDPATRAKLAGHWLSGRDYRGWDPYDGLAAPIAQLPAVRGRRLTRFAFQQVVKRSPLNLRPALRIPPGRNPVTLALAAQAHAYLSTCPTIDLETDHANVAIRLAEELLDLRSPGQSGSCWGYDFDWQARRVMIPAYAPTIVATGIVGHALYEVDRLLDVPGARAAVIDSLPFLTTDLHRSYDPDGSFCWAYSPFDRQRVLNANMKGARLCAHVSRLTGDSEAASLAEAASAFVAKHQRSDGSWPYALDDERSWADNFHTGYVLECLSACGGQPAAVEAGLRFYRSHFFEDDGAPRYFPDKPRPIDATACAQSVLTLCALGKLAQAVKVASWSDMHMSNSDGSFGYRLGRWKMQKTPFPRWSVAWLFCALARLARETC